MNLFGHTRVVQVRWKSFLAVKRFKISTLHPGASLSHLKCKVDDGRFEDFH